MNGGQLGTLTPTPYLNKGRTTKLKGATMASITKADILAAVQGVTGAPSVGTVAALEPQIVDAIDRLVNGEPVKETRVVKAKETPESA
jgi:hypothetical protein